MIILITGGAGMIGSHICRTALQRGHKVVVVDNLSSYPFNYKRIYLNDILDDITFFQIDIRNEYQLNNLFTIYKFDAVIHAAAYADVGGCVKNFDTDFNNNIIGTQNLLRVSKLFEVKKFTFVSSASVYGIQNKEIFNESDTTIPVSTYGNSKLWGERQTILFHQLYKLPTTSIRYFSVYGAPQIPKVGSHSWCAAIFALRCLNNLPITIYGDGNQFRDFTHVQDIALGTVLATEKDSTVGQIFNLGSGVKTTINRVAELIKQQTNNTGTIFKPLPDGDPYGGIADNTKCKELLDWLPTISFESGVKSYIEWLKEITANNSEIRHYLASFL